MVNNRLKMITVIRTFLKVTTGFDRTFERLRNKGRCSVSGVGSGIP